MEKGQGRAIYHIDILPKNPNFKKITKIMNMTPYFSANIRLLKIGIRSVSNRLDSKGRATVYKAQVRSVVEYASLCWMSASSTTLQLLDSIQNKALRIIGVDAQQARTQLNIFPLHHSHLVATSTLI